MAHSLRIEVQRVSQSSTPEIGAMQTIFRYHDIATTVLTFCAVDEAWNLAQTCTVAARVCVQASNSLRTSWRVLCHLEGSTVFDVGATWCQSSRVAQICGATELPAGLPAGLVHLELRDCRFTEPLVLPADLQSARLSRCRLKQGLGELPGKLARLELLDTKLRCQLKLHTGLHRLKIHGNVCTQHAFPALPASLTELELGGLRELRELPPLPCCLQYFKLRDAMALTALPALPATLRTLIVTDLGSPDALPTSWPPRLQHLELCMHNLTHLPSPLPLSLCSLDVSFCSALTVLPCLPAALQELHITECSELRSIAGPLPTTLRVLRAAFCTSLRALPQPLPAALIMCDVSGCALLTRVEEELPS